MKLNYLRTAAEHHLDSVACHRHLPQKKSHGSFLQSFLLLAALLLTGVGVSWGQTQDLLIPTNTEENGQWNGSDAYTYTVSFSGIGDVKAVFSGITTGSDRDSESKCVKFKMGTAINITAPSGYVITYAKVDFNSSSQFHFNFAQSGGNFLKDGTAESVDWTYTDPQNTIRIANRANVDPASSDVLVKSITIRLHKAPTVTIASNKVIWTTINEPVTLTSTITGGEADHAFGEWHLYSSASDVTYDNDKFLGYSNTGFTFTPSQGIKKNGTDEVLMSGYTNESGPYYIGVHARQECIGGNGWENSANEIYTVNVGVRISVNTSPANLVSVDKFTMYQTGHTDWTITSGNIYGRYTQAYFIAPTVPGYTFDGWYEGDTKKSDQQNGYDYGNVGSDLTLTAKYTPITHPANLTCQNGNADLSKLVAAGSGVTYNGDNGQLTISSYNQYSNGLVLNFATPQDFSYLKKVTVNGAEFKNIPFTDNGGNDHYRGTYTTGDNKTVLDVNNKNNQDYKNITKVFFRDIQAGTYDISSIVFEFDHTPATPQLINGTTATMVIPVGKTLKLSADNKDNTFWRQYDAVNGSQVYTNIPSTEYNTPVREISGLTQGTYYFAAERGRNCETGNHWHAAEEKVWVTVEVEPAGTIPTELDLIKQPIYGQNHGGMAKEYLAIANLKASNGDDVAGWGVTSATGTEYKNTTDDKSTTDVTTKQKIAYVLGGHTYKVNSENGLCISQWGRAGLVENQAALPTRATLMLKAAGTMDFFILAKNLANGGDGSDASRRHIKVWYTNNQNVDASGNRILMPFKCANNNTNNDFWFYGERLEDRSNNLAPLQVGVRLQHLGSDGTCNVFITYEDDVKDENVWIKGILVKRPDLDVTIGRTDKLYYTDGKPNHSNCELTPFGENQPYQWDFGTAGFYAKKPNTSGTATDELKKVNEHDGRTYICGEHNGVQLMDHLLVYSDGKGDDKANFDGRKLTNGHDKYYPEDESDCNEHIEFLHPTKYSGKNTYEEDQVGFDRDRRSFNPILSNGLKVNVTGSGWFTIACAAPNGPVNMKVLSSTNGGSTYINLLREFVVSNEEDADKDDANYNKDTSWHTYRVYLKAHHEQGYKDKDNHFTDQSEGFWDGNVYKQKYTKDNVDYDINDPEESQMSLYVVFDKLETYKGQPVTYADNGNSADAQLNIHYLQWLNEKPVDYVFQREEDPALLNSRQSIVTESATDAKPTLYWQAGTRLVEGKKSSTSKTSNYVGSAYNSAGQQDREVGQKSGNGFVSNGDLNCQWNVAAFAHSAAHTEVAYQGGATNYGNNTTNVYSTDQANGTTSDQNLEFAIPVSGSFFRFMPMKNQFISTWIVPSPDKDGETELTETIYVLDETGKPIPYIQEADMQDANKSKVTQDARERGWVQNASNGLDKPGNTAVFTTQNVDGQTAAVRIDFAALAGKEYFIVSDKGTIALARMKVTGNDYRAKVEEISSPVTLTDGGTDNASKISTAMGGTGRYASENKAITLTGRTFKANTWASLVLPFSLNEKKLEEIFGEGTKCLHFTEVEKATNTIVFTHHFYNMVVAGRPVFIYPTHDVTSPVFTDVTLSAATVTNTGTNDSDFTFQASYDSCPISYGDLFMNNSNGTNYWTGTNPDTKYPGMRSFIKNNNKWDFSTGVSTNIGAKAVFLNFDEIMDEEISTSIDEFVRGEFGENAVVITKSTKAYDLNGRVVADGANIGHLPAGIYIVNGKKFIVK